MIMNLLLTQNDFTSTFKVLPIEAFNKEFPGLHES